MTTTDLETTTRMAVDALRNLAASLRETSQIAAIQSLAAAARQVDGIADGFQDALTAIEAQRARDAEAAQRAVQAANPWRVR